MRKAALVLLTCAALAVSAGAVIARPLVLVELFTSQGCSSCVKSGQIIGALDQHPHVLTLTFPVDYWDYLGWRDTLAKPEFAERQRFYMRVLALRDVYTPQAVVDGHLQAAAVDRDTVEQLVKSAPRAPRDPPQVTVVKTRVAIRPGAPTAGGAAVWLVRYRPGDQSVRVLTGENRGQTFVEHNVVRELSRLGVWRGGRMSFRLPAAADADLTTVVIIQALRTGRVLAVARES